MLAATLAQQYKTLLDTTFPGYEFNISPESTDTVVHYVVTAYTGTVVTISKDIAQIKVELEPKVNKVKKPRVPRSKTINIKELKWTRKQ